MCTGVGGPAGIALLAASGALMSGGISVTTQKASTGEVDWGRVGVDTAIGAVGGAVGAGAGAAVARSGGSALVKGIVSNVAESGANGAGSYAATPGPHTVNGLLRATAESSATGLVPLGGRGPTQRLGDLSPNPYQGVREASQWLQEQGVPRQYRVEALQSFSPGTVSLQTADSSVYGLRHYGGEAQAAGRYLTPTLPATRSELALPQVNTMERLAQWQIPEGQKYLSGQVGPNFGYPGGGRQMYVPDPSVLQRME